MAISSAWRRGSLRTHMGASMQFCSTVRCGNRLKCWKTMPTSLRIASICLRSLVNSTPLITMRPCWCSSSRLRQRMVVDLPEPDGPHNTMRSPWVTLRSMSLSTWNWPNHLFTPCIWMTGSPERSGCEDCSDVSLMMSLLTPVTGVELAFQMHGIARHAETEQPIDQRGEYVAL